jgi:hypothetical protein
MDLVVPVSGSSFGLGSPHHQADRGGEVLELRKRRQHKMGLLALAFSFKISMNNICLKNSFLK